LHHDLDLHGALCPFGTGSSADASGARGVIAWIFIYSTGYAVFFNAMV
jgi:hypothetical protein